MLTPGYAPSLGALSPYVLPRVEWLKLALRRVIDFAALRKQTTGPELYVTATNINHNRRDIFARTAITYDVLAASACIPTIFPARPMTVDGTTEYYWDGGFMGNPSLFPMLEHCSDVIVIQVNCFERPDSPPRTVAAIQNRQNEITFNSALVLELSTIQTMNLHARQTGRPETYLHAIGDEAYMGSQGYASKLVILREYLEELHDKGWAAADAWLGDARKGGQLGQRTTLDSAILEHLVTHQPVIRRHRPEPDESSLPAKAESSAWS